MSEDRDVVARGLAAYDELHAAHQEVVARADSFERAMVVANAENEKLRREIKQVRANRDHLFKAYAALKATLESFIHFSQAGAQILDNAVKMADSHSYSEEQTTQNVTVLRGSPSK